jgi:hypothetical protein
MSNSNTNLLTIFNDHFIEFINDIQSVFPDDPDILTAKNALSSIRKANPKLIPRIWIKYVATPYHDRIVSGDLNFFIEKDYKKDFVYINHSDDIISNIDKLREPVRNMSKENQEKSLMYVKNLCILSKLYIL